MHRKLLIGSTNDIGEMECASQALAEFLKVETQRPIYGRIAFDNIGSQRVLKKCGVKKVGTGHFFANALGQEIEEIIYELEE